MHLPVSFLYVHISAYTFTQLCFWGFHPSWILLYLLVYKYVFSLNCAAWRVFHVIFQRSVLFFLLPMDSRSILLIFPFSLVGWVSASLYLQSPLFLCLLCAFPVLIWVSPGFKFEGQGPCKVLRLQAEVET